MTETLYDTSTNINPEFYTDMCKKAGLENISKNEAKKMLFKKLSTDDE
jgi:hypothetical protein